MIALEKEPVEMEKDHPLRREIEDLAKRVDVELPGQIRWVRSVSLFADGMVHLDSDGNLLVEDYLKKSTFIKEGSYPQWALLHEDWNAEAEHYKEMDLAEAFERLRDWTEGWGFKDFDYDRDMAMTKDLRGRMLVCRCAERDIEKAYKKQGLEGVAFPKEAEYLLEYMDVWLDLADLRTQKLAEGKFDKEEFMAIMEERALPEYDMALFENKHKALLGMTADRFAHEHGNPAARLKRLEEQCIWDNPAYPKEKLFALTHQFIKAGEIKPVSLGIYREVRACANQGGKGPVRCDECSVKKQPAGQVSR